MEQLAQPGASLVQLRFRISDRKAQHRSNFIVFVSLDIVEHESLLIAGRQLSDSTLEMHSIDGARQYQVGSAVFLWQVFGLFSSSALLQRSSYQRLLAQAHQYNVCRQPMQPGGERRFATECVDLAKHLQERVLGQFFGFGGRWSSRR